MKSPGPWALTLSSRLPGTPCPRPPAPGDLPPVLVGGRATQNSPPASPRGFCTDLAVRRGRHVGATRPRGPKSGASGCPVHAPRLLRSRPPPAPPQVSASGSLLWCPRRGLISFFKTPLLRISNQHICRRPAYISCNFVDFKERGGRREGGREVGGRELIGGLPRPLLPPPQRPRVGLRPAGGRGVQRVVPAWAAGGRPRPPAAGPAPGQRPLHCSLGV